MKFTYTLIALFFVSVVLVFSACNTFDPAHGFKETETGSIDLSKDNRYLNETEPESVTEIESELEPVLEPEKTSEQNDFLEKYGIFYPDLEHIAKLFSMQKNEVLNWLGNDYEIVMAGAENTEEAYEYREFGMVIIFDSWNNPDTINYIDCTEIINIKGAKLGMTFTEIQEVFPECEIFPIQPIVPTVDPRFALTYNWDKLIIWFGAMEEDGEAIRFEIRRNYMLE